MLLAILHAPRLAYDNLHPVAIQSQAERYWSRSADQANLPPGQNSLQNSVPPDFSQYPPDLPQRQLRTARELNRTQMESPADSFEGVDESLAGDHGGGITGLLRS